MAVNYKREWLKERILSFIGVDEDMYFEEMMAANNQELEDKLTAFLDDDLLPYPDGDIEKMIFHVRKSYCDRLFEEEIYVDELVERPPPEEEEEEIEAVPSHRKLKKKGKEKASSGGKGAHKEKGKKTKKAGRATPESKLEPPSEGEETDAEAEEDAIITETEFESGIETEEESMAKEVKVVSPEAEETASPEPPSVATTADEEKQDGSESPVPGKAAKTKGKKGKKAKGKKKTKEPSVVMEEEPEPEPEYIKVKKIIQKIVRSPILHGGFGMIPDTDMDNVPKRVYVLRITDEAVPNISSMEEARIKLPQYFSFGSFSYQVLISLDALLRTLYIPLVEAQFREPDSNTKSTDVIQEDVASSDESAYSEIRKPSDFRRISLTQNKDAAFSESDSAIMPSKMLLLADMEKTMDVVQW